MNVFRYANPLVLTLNKWRILSVSLLKFNCIMFDEENVLNENPIDQDGSTEEPSVEISILLMIQMQ